MIPSLSFRRAAASVVRWLDTTHGPALGGTDADDRVDWVRIVPFILLHLACGAVLFVGWSPAALAVAAALYAVRMFAVTAFYHRYFSHRAYRTSRPAQFLFAVAGNASVQRGPLWWAAHHRTHHRHADGAGDPHSPGRDGFLWSHALWLTTRRNFRTDLSCVPDLACFPELRFLDRFDWLVPALLAAVCYLVGETLPARLGTSGPQMLVWGFVVSTLVLFHATCTINSLAHRYGARRYDTDDDSRNNGWLALITFGEGWHNNHHHCPGAVRQGFFWWEFDLTYWGLRVLERVGLVSHLNPVSARAYTTGSGAS